MVAVLTDTDVITPLRRVRDGGPVREHQVRPGRLSTGRAVDGAGALCVVSSGGAPVVALTTARPRPQRRHDRAVYRRRRTVAAGLAVTVTLGLWSGARALLGEAGAATPMRPVAARMYVVRPGDTLWSIALKLQPHGDIRPLVDALSSQVHGRPLQIGEEISVP